MSEIALELDSIGIETEMKQSYLDYAMSVIVGRALPDVRDGLKPVHRRVLYAMRELGNSWNSPYKKSARIVGDVIGKYHPHGDTAVYDTMVRMAQPFSMRYMLVDGQGNFGSVDGDPPAAMRYTEVRMAKIAHEMLADLEKETVDFVPNYDESESEPAVLPTKIPALLVNGSSGIAVGMATNIPPHNLTEILNACIAIIDNPDVTTHELMEYVPGPDFPTSGIINGARGIAEAYQTGRGRVHIRARADIETNEASGQQSIVVKELPYQVNKARLLEKIAELVKDKKIEGISALRDESDKDGMRMVIVLKRGEVPEVILNNLYQQTQMQTVFGINMVAIVDGQPRTLNLKEILDAFIRHRREVVTRRSIYDLRKARERAHVLEGLATALANIDEVIELIKASPNPAEAKEALLAKGWASGMILEMLGAAGAESSRPEDLAEQYGLVNNLYHLSPVQAQAILDMRLHRLTGLEQDKILQEYREVLEVIAELLAILSDPDNLMAVIREELVAINAEYGDERRTEILANHLDLTLEDLITEEEMVVTLSHAGYAKTQQLDTYQAQKRGGKGKAATAMKDEDFIEHLFIANTHDTLLCFSSAGKVYWKKVYELPQGSRASRGKPIINLLPLEEGEKINAVLPIREFEADKFIFMATASGTVKKTPLVDYSRPRANGIIAVDLKEDDQLIDVAVTNGHSDVMLFSNTGKVIRFAETDVRSMGRVSRGVRGMRIGDDEKIISLIIAEEDGAILTATEFGYGKRTNLAEYRVQGRGGQGIISIQTSERNGCVVGAVQVCDEHQIMLITNGGTLVRTPVKDVSLVGRNTQGVRLINLSNGEKLVGLERVIEDEDPDVDLAIDDVDDTDETTEE
ncbi:DNA gyrase subunit A [Methylophaga sp.]|uniref:DNA gyrase subunit A n=1 Tax=Methylophaga sp. TaxID=2024840 RepID=UPI003A9442BB